MLSFSPTILVVALLLPTTVSPFSMPHGSAINVGGIHHSSYFNNIHHSTTISSTTTQLNVLRRPLLSEDDLAKPPDSKIINAVESIRGGKVIASGTFLISIYTYIYLFLHYHHVRQSLLNSCLLCVVGYAVLRHSRDRDREREIDR